MNQSRAVDVGLFRIDWKKNRCSEEKKIGARKKGQVESEKYSVGVTMLS